MSHPLPPGSATSLPQQLALPLNVPGLIHYPAAEIQETLAPRLRTDSEVLSAIRGLSHAVFIRDRPHSQEAVSMLEQNHIQAGQVDSRSATSYRCNHEGEQPSASPGPEQEGLEMAKDDKKQELLERLIECPDWATLATDPDARIGDDEWKEWGARAAWERQKRGELE